MSTRFEFGIDYGNEIEGPFTTASIAASSRDSLRRYYRTNGIDLASISPGRIVRRTVREEHTEWEPIT